MNHLQRSHLARNAKSFAILSGAATGPKSYDGMSFVFAGAIRGSAARARADKAFAIANAVKGEAVGRSNHPGSLVSSLPIGTGQ